MEQPIYKKPILWIILISILILSSGGVFFLKGRHGAPKKEEEVVQTPQEILPTIDSSVMIDLVPRDDRKAVILRISNIPSGVTGIEYELTYEAKGGLPRGVLGRIELKNNNFIDREILLGTCSRNTCVYDEGVTKVSLVLKFISPTGQSQFQKDFPL